MPIINSVCEKFDMHLTGCLKCYFLIFAFFIFSKFPMIIVKNLMERPTFFIMNFEGSNRECSSKYFWSTFFWQRNDGLLQVFWNFHGNAFCFFILFKWKKYYNLTFRDTFKMYCCALCCNCGQKIVDKFTK